MGGGSVNSRKSPPFSFGSSTLVDLESVVVGKGRGTESPKSIWGGTGDRPAGHYSSGTPLEGSGSLSSEGRGSSGMVEVAGHRHGEVVARLVLEAPVDVVEGPQEGTSETRRKVGKVPPVVVQEIDDPGVLQRFKDFVSTTLVLCDYPSGSKLEARNTCLRVCDGLRVYVSSRPSRSL